MSLPSIEVSGLGKRYVLEHESRHDNLRDTLHHTARKLWRRARWGTSFDKEEFWALQDVSFSVQPGEVVGIIGRNGAGKSTLLKILSRITEPTTGSISLRGRVASLLEVGTGFHPELSGRENIFLNGAILGMSRVEIRKKFDEIVAFAEVERFLDTPVKRYSSGMYVRLAFAVAAHLEPEILIVDEVLAVGDATFQKKCLGKIKSVSRNEGRSVLFVSHNMAAVQSLCTRAICLTGGHVVLDGSVEESVKSYLALSPGVKATGHVDLTQPGFDRMGDGRARLQTLELRDADNEPSATFGFGEPIELWVTILVEHALDDAIIGFSINTLDDQVIACSNHHDTLPREALAAGTHEFTVRISDLWLSPGDYAIPVAITAGTQMGAHDFVKNCTTFSVAQRHHRLDTQSPYLLDARPGYIRQPLKWLHHMPG